MSDRGNLSPDVQRTIRRTELFWLALLVIGVIRAGLAFHAYLTAAP
ncbi:hypothetical protein J2X65_003188 [Ancylobacter sp. 3268]|nr:hypothetical protein [Ancylobacter sp. 3268]MDR6953825.1 hypothetical protein [Ancylobacter sp. 3268]